MIEKSYRLPKRGAFCERVRLIRKIQIVNSIALLPFAHLIHMSLRNVLNASV
jgi:hypothetical protein